MARERMVTRTIVTREVNFKKYNLEGGNIELDKMVFGVNVTLKDNTQIIALINEKLHEIGQNATCVMIDSVEEKETLYGMTEEDFIRLAKVLPPRGADAE